MISYDSLGDILPEMIRDMRFKIYVASKKYGFSLIIVYLKMTIGINVKSRSPQMDCFQNRILLLV